MSRKEQNFPGNATLIMLLISSFPFFSVKMMDDGRFVSHHDHDEIVQPGAPCVQTQIAGLICL